jgi:hypothetical protein
MQKKRPPPPLEESFIFRYEELKMCNVSLLKEGNTNTVCYGRGRLHGVNSFIVIGHSKTIARMHGSSTTATIMALSPTNKENKAVQARHGSVQTQST